jgi:hypothetical protein
MVDVRDVVCPARPIVNLMWINPLARGGRWREINGPGGGGLVVREQQFLCRSCDDRS